jgi:hypothetical protein
MRIRDRRRCKQETAALFGCGLMATGKSSQILGDGERKWVWYCIYRYCQSGVFLLLLSAGTCHRLDLSAAEGKGKTLVQSYRVWCFQLVNYIAG